MDWFWCETVAWSVTKSSLPLAYQQADIKPSDNENLSILREMLGIALASQENINITDINLIL